MDELIRAIRACKERLATTQASLNLPQKQQRLAELQDQMSGAGFWTDQRSANRISREAAALERTLAFWSRTGKRLDDALAVALADQADQGADLREDLEQELSRIQKDIDREEAALWLTGKYDQSPAIVTIYSGAGGVDAQDWAQMLERMYLRFAETHAYRATVLQRTAGQEAGIKNVTLRFEGPNAYGYLKTESGVHRLVRLSPFDADQARHTSFAMVEVLPELEEIDTIEVGKDDVRVDVFRSSGHGGQSVNTTDSAVRLTHLATGITVSCQNERSQLQNKEQAWRLLLGKLARYYEAEREEERQILRGELTEAAWGNQIRSYVIHPYKMVKDHRTKFESKEPDTVLDGALMPFMEAELRRQGGSSA